MWDWQGSSSTVSQPSKSHLSCTLEFPDFCMMSPSVTLLIVLLLPFLIFASGVTNGWLSQWCRSVCDVGTGRWADNGRNWIVVTWGGDTAQEAVACCSPGVSSEISASEKPPWQHDRCFCRSRGCFLCFWRHRRVKTPQLTVCRATRAAWVVSASAGPELLPADGSAGTVQSVTEGSPSCCTAPASLKPYSLAGPKG